MTFLFVGFVLALAAGVSGGLLLARFPVAHDDGPGQAAATSPLAAELGLSTQQAEQMRTIWEGVRGTAQQCFDDARRLQKERDDALVSLLNEEQKAKFAAISKEYADGFAELNRKRDQEFKKAVSQTKRVLTDEQWKKYERILKSRVGPGPLRELEGGVMTPPAEEGGI
jgi:Spy/CpxP family protein refolding chaperone